MPAQGRYISQADLEAAFSADAVRSWSRKGGDLPTTDEAAVSSAISMAESLVDSRLRRQYQIPLTLPNGTAGLTSGDQLALRRLCVPLAAYELYAGRGMQDEDPAGNKLSAGRAAALEELGLYLGGSIQLDAPRIDRTPRGPDIG